MEHCQQIFRKLDLSEKVAESVSRAETVFLGEKLAQTEGFEKL